MSKDIIEDLEKSMYGTDLFGHSMAPKNEGVVLDKFGQPPFTVLDARKGEWQDRKRKWVKMGIESEVGRDAPVLSISMRSGDGGTPQEDYTSIFDPVLTECMYRWFCPDGGQIVDPFAGGSVRGIVAGMLGRKYWGCDLRQEQVDANIKQLREKNWSFDKDLVEWRCGDSLKSIHTAPASDFFFSCPPYGDLEVYSDDASDLSNMSHSEFKEIYERIIYWGINYLKKDRFAAFVVGDFRNKSGHYRNFVSDTIKAFELAGARLYNEGILVTSVGSGSMRANRVFSAGRKFVKTHQNVLVFVKGDWKKAAAACRGEE